MQIVSKRKPSIDKELFLKGIDNAKLVDFIKAQTEFFDEDNMTVLSVNDKFTIENLKNPTNSSNKFGVIINLKRANDVGRITELYSSINTKLETGGRLITCVETAELRKERLYKKFPPIVNSIYYFFDYFGKRVAPKLPISNKVYFFLTANRNRVLTSVEVLGRLAYCGFKIIHTQRIDGLLYITAEKEVHKVNVKPRSYGFFLKIVRSGYQGELINVYKVRTMHAYSEYLQEYVYESNKLDDGGKFKDDFRVNFLGKILRRLWLDELPMLYNWFKGDVKFVGVRPLSAHYLSLYSEELKERRLNFKPGLVPPYYADMPSTMDEIMESEMRYFDAYEKHPLKTDVTYFFKSLKNIVVRKARSK